MAVPPNWYGPIGMARLLAKPVPNLGFISDLLTTPSISTIPTDAGTPGAFSETVKLPGSSPIARPMSPKVHRLGPVSVETLTQMILINLGLPSQPGPAAVILE